MPIKLKRPTRIAEVKEYNLQIARYLFSMLKDKIKITFGDITEKELFDPNYKFNMKRTDTPLTKEDLKRGKQMGKEGQIPGAILDLPPILFTSKSDAKSAVPYLNVRAVSWLNTDNPKMLYHSLLSLIRQNNSNES